jgi:adenylate cyclase
MLLASRRLVGDDGPYASVRETSEETGIDLELLQRIRRAMGLPAVDDPDATVHLRADAEAAAYAQRFIEFGIEPEQIVPTTRVLAEGLARAAEVMRYAALAAVLNTGATELEIAKGSEALVRRSLRCWGRTALMCPDSCRMPVRLLSDAGVAAASPSLIDELTDEIAEHVRLLVDRRRRRPPTPAQHEHINFHGTYNLDAESELRCQGHRPLRSPAA